MNELIVSIMTSLGFSAMIRSASKSFNRASTLVRLRVLFRLALKNGWFLPNTTFTNECCRT